MYDHDDDDFQWYAPDHDDDDRATVWFLRLWFGSLMLLFAYFMYLMVRLCEATL